jgi:hypothetical protein
LFTLLLRFCAQSGAFLADAGDGSAGVDDGGATCVHTDAPFLQQSEENADQADDDAVLAFHRIQK